MSIDQRGFKHFIQAEAAEFLHPDQLMLNSTVTNITYSSEGVNVALEDGTVLLADYVLCTFSLGVLQNDDVTFIPPLPDWKQEAIQSMTMVRYASRSLERARHSPMKSRPRIRRFSCSSQRTSGLIPRWESTRIPRGATIQSGRT